MNQEDSKQYDQEKRHNYSTYNDKLKIKNRIETNFEIWRFEYLQ